VALVTVCHCCGGSARRGLECSKATEFPKPALLQLVLVFNGAERRIVVCTGGCSTARVLQCVQRQLVVLIDSCGCCS
jgi:hypothetical protein